MIVCNTCPLCVCVTADMLRVLMRILCCTNSPRQTGTCVHVYRETIGTALLTENSNKLFLTTVFQHIRGACLFEGLFPLKHGHVCMFVCARLCNARCLYVVRVARVSVCVGVTCLSLKPHPFAKPFFSLLNAYVCACIRVLTKQVHARFQVRSFEMFAKLHFAGYWIRSRNCRTATWCMGTMPVFKST